MADPSRNGLLAEWAWGVAVAGALRGSSSVAGRGRWGRMFADLVRPSYGEDDPRAWEASEQVGGSPELPNLTSPDPLWGLVLNEWLLNPTTPSTGFIELYNSTTNAVNISGCWLSDDPATNRFQIPA